MVTKRQIFQEFKVQEALGIITDRDTAHVFIQSLGHYWRLIEKYPTLLKYINKKYPYRRRLIKGVNYCA